jgi:hypothetical protein
VGVQKISFKQETRRLESPGYDKIVVLKIINHQTMKQKPLYSRTKNTNKETKENQNEEINTRENYHETSTDNDTKTSSGKTQ